MIEVKPGLGPQQAGPPRGTAATASPGRGGGAAVTAVPRPGRRWKTRLLLPLTLVLSALLLMGYAARDALTPAADVEAVPVVVRSLGQAARGMSDIVQAPGWIEPHPFATQVTAQRDGIVQDVLVLEGDHVEAGQVVARIVDADARLGLRRAEAHFARATAVVAAARQALGDGSPGSGLAELEAEVARWPAEVARLEATRAELELELAARRLAAQRDLVAPVQVQRLEARLQAQEAEVEAARLQATVLEARLDRQRQQLAAALQAAEADLAVAQADRDEARLLLQRCEIISPVSGVVLARLVEPGSLVQADENNSGVARLYDPARLQVRADVPLAQAARIGVGVQAQIVVDVLADQVFTGRVTRVIQEADISRNTLAFLVTIDDPSPHLKPQMLARVRFIAATREAGDGSSGAGGVFAPMRIVGRGGDGSVWIVDAAGHASRRTITVGQMRHGDWIEVTTGLNPGDRLIVNPPAELVEGRRLRVRESGHSDDDAFKIGAEE